MTSRKRVESIYAEIGERIRDTRQIALMYQGELADRADILRTSLSMMENGEQRILLHHLLAIARVLDVPYTLFIPNEGVDDGRERQNSSDT